MPEVRPLLHARDESCRGCAGRLTGERRGWQLEVAQGVSMTCYKTGSRLYPV
jgi:hypothetical protein